MVGVLAAVIIGVSYGVSWWMGPVAQLAVAALGVPIAIVQGAVAWTNHTNKLNAVTRLVVRMHGELPRL